MQHKGQGRKAVPFPRACVRAATFPGARSQSRCAKRLALEFESFFNSKRGLCLRATLFAVIAPGASEVRRMEVAVAVVALVLVAVVVVFGVGR